MNAMRHTRPLRARVPRLAWMVVLLGLSCDSPTGPESGKIRRVAAISVDPVAPTVVLGTDVPLSAVVKDQDGDVIPDAKVVWSVRDTAIASVSSTGVVTPRVVGGTQDRNAPVRVAGGHVFSSIRAFGSHTCGTTTSGEAFCWGYNLDGQLGDGTRVNRARPAAALPPG